ncbi:MAG TPA: ferritin-like domain-containing protein, partial [Sorangium sp.]|nr:ferritin-like domain-containing protein [Sorangium sp.]
MNADEFLDELDQKVGERLARIGTAAGAAEPRSGIGIPELLATALKKELEATEEAALWLTTETDVEVKLALARQCGDEARHYRLIAERLRALGVDPAALPARFGPPTPMFGYLKGLGSTVERVAAGQFTREALAKVHNQAFIDYCEAQGDAETARLYRDVIQPDEAHHHALGRKLLARLAQSEADRDLARRASARTLELAEELQELARLKKG